MCRKCDWNYGFVMLLSLAAAVTSCSLKLWLWKLKYEEGKVTGLTCWVWKSWNKTYCKTFRFVFFLNSLIFVHFYKFFLFTRLLFFFWSCIIFQWYIFSCTEYFKTMHTTSFVRLLHFDAYTLGCELENVFIFYIVHNKHVWCHGKLQNELAWLIHNVLPIIITVSSIRDTFFSPKYPNFFLLLFFERKITVS